MSLSTDDQMPMVGHEAVGQQIRRVPALQTFGEDAFEGGVIALIIEELEPKDAAVKDVVDDAGERFSGWAGHGDNIPRSRGGVNKST